MRENLKQPQIQFIPVKSSARDIKLSTLVRTPVNFSILLRFGFKINHAVAASAGN